VVTNSGDQEVLDILETPRCPVVAVTKFSEGMLARRKRPLAFVGVDNDELLCETADPPLTSIAIDHERLGELAADCGFGSRRQHAAAQGE
jgi:hypothetical protein